MAEAFQFELVSPERLLLSEQVTEVVVPGTEGYMTVMAHHAPLMATVKPGVVAVKTADGKPGPLRRLSGASSISRPTAARCSQNRQYTSPI